MASPTLCLPAVDGCWLLWMAARCGCQRRALRWLPAPRPAAAARSARPASNAEQRQATPSSSSKICSNSEICSNAEAHAENCDGMLMRCDINVNVEGCDGCERGNNYRVIAAVLRREHSVSSTQFSSIQFSSTQAFSKHRASRARCIYADRF